ncbi:metal ABC transporter permease [Gracilibacillus saliphilus]|uniref:metal ABC transporter permease n=1 Tax=Gracilibacillus saliphilus TaxID=543890 RepID=UPI0013D0C749|nr:metal ABC transporter permease [Gracilibacillus saliphilus]
MTTYTMWIIITGCLVGFTCGISGSILVLRKMAMIADAISHTVLLGIVLAFFVTQSISGFPMLIGALVIGLFTAIFIEMLHRTGIPSDAAIGVVFTSLFALGVVLISFIGNQVHLDVKHALMGEITFVPWNQLTFAGVNYGPVAVWMLSIVCILNIVMIIIFYRPIKISTFDPAYAKLIGIPVGFIHYLLMSMVSLSTVASFDSVGAILVVAMLIVPGATAYLLSERFLLVIVLSGLIGILSAISGYMVASFWNVSIAGAMATMTGVFFLLAYLFSPKQGVLVKKIQHKKSKVRVS